MGLIAGTGRQEMNDRGVGRDANRASRAIPGPGAPPIGTASIGQPSERRPDQNTGPMGVVSQWRSRCASARAATILAREGIDVDRRRFREHPANRLFGFVLLNRDTTTRSWVPSASRKSGCDHHVRETVCTAFHTGPEVLEPMRAFRPVATIEQ